MDVAFDRFGVGGGGAASYCEEPLDRLRQLVVERLWSGECDTVAMRTRRMPRSTCGNRPLATIALTVHTLIRS
jgi:hypothetical protein